MAVNKMADNKYQTRHWKYGGMTKGFRFKLCPQCGRQGVSLKIMKGRMRQISQHKTCKYCGWFEVK